MQLDEIHRKAQEFEKKIRWRNLKLLAAVILIAFLGWRTVIAQHVSERIMGGVIIGAGLYVVYQLYKRGSARAVAPDATFATCREFYRAELERQRDALRGIWSWYLGPILGALMAFAMRVPLAHLDRPGLWWRMAPFVVLSVLWCFWMGRLTQRAARKLQREIDELDALEKQ